MGIKKYNPYTPSRRQMTGLDFAAVTKKTPEKSAISVVLQHFFMWISIFFSIICLIF